jgi:hypothetical protein
VALMRLSTAQKKAVELIRKHGVLYRHAGGFWAEKHPSRNTFGTPTAYAGTSTVDSLVRAGIFNRTGRDTVEMDDGEDQ